MTEHPSPFLTPFAWVRKRDGRMAPFEADKISQALFAATETLGRPDAFMARELTDGVLHFLALDITDTTPATSVIADLVIKVVRELGQPDLALAFAEAGRQKAERRDRGQPAPTHLSATITGSAAKERARPSTHQLSAWVEESASPREVAWRAASASLRSYALEEVFSRDLVSAHAEGLLQLTGLETPLELAASVLTPPVTAEGSLVIPLLEAIEEARATAGALLVLDGPEYYLARASGEEDPRSAVASFLRALEMGLRLTQLWAVLNLGSMGTPPWAEELAGGPLFGSRSPALEPRLLAEFRNALATSLLAGVSTESRVRLDWHLSERDFTPSNKENMMGLARRAIAGADLSLVFDRQRRPIELAEGLDRRCPALLMTVQLNLLRLVQQSAPGIDAALFLQKLGSLARLALSAGTQKRDFLRSRSQGRMALTRGFLLERAKLVVVPTGLEETVRAVLGADINADGAALTYACQLLQRLRDVLRQDGKSTLLDTSLHALVTREYLGPGEFASTRSFAGRAEEAPPDSRPSRARGSASPAKALLRMAASLFASADTGTLLLKIAEPSQGTAEDVAALLQSAWQEPDLPRLRFQGVEKGVRPPS